MNLYLLRISRELLLLQNWRHSSEDQIAISLQYCYAKATKQTSSDANLLGKRSLK